VDVSVVSTDLETPVYKEVKINSPNAAWIYSKNPGGGISTDDLVKVEKTLCASIPNARLILHPRDNCLKLALRHKCNSLVLKSFLRGLLPDPRGENRLVISSYSTALFDKPKSGDYALNVGVAQSDCKVRKLVYHGLPYLSVDAANFTSENIVNVAQIQ
jgi:hypothetical protein